MSLTVLTYNTLFAGRDGADDRRARAQIDLIAGLDMALDHYPVLARFEVT